MAATTPRLVKDMLRIHKVITRAINIGRVKGEEYIQSGLISPEELQGYFSYIHSLVAVLDAHHTAEDLIIFPEFQKIIPAAPFSRLTAEHHEIAKHLSSIRSAQTNLADDSTNRVTLIVKKLQMIYKLWPFHYQMEERYFSEPSINASLDEEQQNSISAAVTKHNQDYSEPPFWVVPFILYNLEDEDRAAMAASFPPLIMQELLPKAWKNQWEPMKPFLLD